MRNIIILIFFCLGLMWADYDPPQPQELPTVRVYYNGSCISILHNTIYSEDKDGILYVEMQDGRNFQFTLNNDLYYGVVENNKEVIYHEN